ncbi:MAG: PDGLE domain-containing protein [Thermodesulfovibrionales bacterium]
MTGFQKKLVAGLIVMAVLSPLGIIIPEAFHAGDAWGEWGKDTLKELLGFVPEGLQRLSATWTAPVPDYNFGSGESSLSVQVFSYILSALVGIAIAASVIYLISRLLRQGNGK